MFAFCCNRQQTQLCYVMKRCTTTTTISYFKKGNHFQVNNNSVRSYFRFELVHKSSKKGSNARVGRIHTPHGIIDTPNFVAVGTNGSLKGPDNFMLSEAMANVDIQLMFCNTYHMMIHPGTEVVKQGGGLHKYINRNKPIITDSGGFQVFSLATQEYHAESNELQSTAKELKGGNLKKHQAMAKYDPQSEEKQGKVLKVTEDGITFRSYKDGKILLLTPETSIQAQKNLGADIIIPLDELLPLNVSRKKLLDSLARTHAWEKRSLNEHLRNPNQQAMYAVIHGGVDQELRQISIDTLTAEPFDGFAIGGSLGKDRDELIDVLKFVVPRVNETGKPNHVLGIGDTESILRFVSLGVDTFDSAYPTRIGRHGHLLVNLPNNGGVGIASMRQDKYLNMFEPVDPTCNCYVCKNYTASYLHHLYKMHEPAFVTLSAIHNLHFLFYMTKRIREQILNDEI